MSEKSKCLVLGAKGFIGSAIVQVASERGFEVLSVDMDNYESSRGAEVDLLINANGNSKKFLAAQNPALEFDLSVRSVMKALHNFKVARYIHLSTMDVYPEKSNPALNAETAAIEVERLSPYGLHKRMAEMLVERYAPNWLMFRMAGFVGNGLKKNSIYDMLKGQKLYVSPSSRYQYIDTRDLAQAVLDLAGQPVKNEIFNIAGDGTVSLAEAAALIGYDLSQCEPALPVDHCELNIAKIKTRLALPRTEATVRQFIGNIRAGKAVLA